MYTDTTSASATYGTPSPLANLFKRIGKRPHKPTKGAYGGRSKRTRTIAYAAASSAVRQDT